MYENILFTKTIRTQSYYLIISLITFSLVLLFNHKEANASEVRQHGAHEHGVGKINIVLDGQDLVMELFSPAINIVGFEHKPTNEQQEQKIQKSTDLLKSWEKMFVISPQAQCTLHEIHVDNDMLTEAHHPHHEHAEEHMNSQHEDEIVHSEFKATYHLKCEAPNDIKTLNVMLFSYFPGFEELEVQLLTPKHQTAIELTPEKIQISL